MNAMTRPTLLLLWLVLLGLLFACTPTPEPTPTPAPTPVPDLGKIALFLPEKTAPRYEKFDYPYFRDRLAELGFNVEEDLLYYNAENDHETQSAQVDEALAAGAKVLVIDPVDSEKAAELAIRAKDAGALVVAYDRAILLTNKVDYYVNFDTTRVGELQAQSLLDALTAVGKDNPNLILIHGSPTDANVIFLKQGISRAFEGQTVTILGEYDNTDWTPATAEAAMRQALTDYGAQIDGVYAANDGTAEGVLNAYRAFPAFTLETLPPITGQDADLPAVQRILAGEQYSTIYKPIPREASAAADLAYALLNRLPFPTGLVNSSAFNGQIDVPAVLLDPVLVTRDNIRQTVIADDFWSTSDICVTEYEEACRTAGLIE
jgi:D-xylose transport system substrate-binding protein